jgi:hypothetical protein
MNAPPPEIVQPLISADKLQYIVLAIISAVLSIPFLGEKFTWKLALLAIGAGCLLSFVATEPLASWLSLDKAYWGVLGSALGFFGYTVLGILMGIVQIVKKDPIGTLKQFVPFLKKGGGQ